MKKRIGGGRHLLHAHSGASRDLKFCPCGNPVGGRERYPFLWAAEASFSRGISSASKGSRSEAPCSEGFQLPLGKLAFLSGNYSLSIFAEHRFPQPRHSWSTAFPGEVENSGEALCRRLVKINCQVIQGLNSISHVWEES